MWVSFKYFEDPEGKLLLWELDDWGTTTSAGTTITIESDYSFKIPNAILQLKTGDKNLEANFKFFDNQYGKALWVLDSYTVK